MRERGRRATRFDFNNVPLTNYRAGLGGCGKIITDDDLVRRHSLLDFSNLLVPHFRKVVAIPADVRKVDLGLSASEVSLPHPYSNGSTVLTASRTSLYLMVIEQSRPQLQTLCVSRIAAIRVVFP
jgi:hypothetical protein